MQKYEIICTYQVQKRESRKTGCSLFLNSFFAEKSIFLADTNILYNFAGLNLKVMIEELKQRVLKGDKIS